MPNHLNNDSNGISGKPPVVVPVQMMNGKRTGKVILGIKKESDLRRSSAAIKRIIDEFPLQQQQYQQLQQQQNSTAIANLTNPANTLDSSIENEEFRSETSDPAQRLLQLQEMVVGGEQANNEELKKKRIKKKKYAEERKRLLAESLRHGDDEEFMLRVYDSVQEEVQYKTKSYEREREKCKFLENEVKDLQQEFEKEREDLLDTIRKNEKQIKLIIKILHKIQPIIPHDSNYYNLDKIQSASIWNEEVQDWVVPDYRREKLSLPTMGNEPNEQEQAVLNGSVSSNGLKNGIIDYENYEQQQYASNQGLLNARRTAALLNETAAVRGGPSVNSMSNGYSQINLREPEIDRYRIKLENSQFNGSNYFKTKRQSELLGQTQDIRTNGRLSPLSNNSTSGESRANRRFN